MPYVSNEDRVAHNNGHSPVTPGQLNYAITNIIDEYLLGNLSYGLVNEVIGVLECAKLELYRRVAAPYEDKKLAENGDVYSRSNLTN